MTTPDADRRTTSAGYRLPLGKTSSPHHAVSRKAPATSAPSSQKKKESAECNEVAQNKIWRERIEDEWKGVSEWKRNWGFLKDFDPRGRPKTPEVLPEREAVFSDKIPNTRGHEYGKQINTEIGQQMACMEHKFDCGCRKRKLGTEFVCF